MIKCGECVRHDNCWLYDEHKDDNGTCVWAESKSITESPNEVVEKNDEVIESKVDHTRIDHDREWIIGCIKHDGFIKTDRFDTANQIILDALETDTDLISRADAVQCKPEFLNPTQNGESNEYNIGWNEAVKMYIHSLEEVPSVSAERVGEWIFNGYADEKKSWFICSECDHSQFHKSNYCHNCGARMVKESEE